jgi:VCBS repeat-containing protein
MPKLTLLKQWGLIFCCTTMVFSCTIDTDISDRGINAPNYPDLVTKVTTSVITGFVTDENDHPVNGALVETGAFQTSTDRNGFFKFNNAVVTKEAATVSVSLPNYFKIVKTFLAEQAKGAFLRIKLIPKTTDGTINAATGGTLNLASGIKISIPANAVVDAISQTAYSGTINVMAKLLSADNPDLCKIMPGDLRGISSQNIMKTLTTFGMIAVELTDANNKLLQIAAGKTATLSFPIPTALFANAPATISLWYFDNSTGLWREEGAATKTGAAYTAEVTHFSFWNCDAPGAVVQFNCTIAGPNGMPISGAMVKLSLISNPQDYRSAFTDESGYVAGPVPANTNFKLQVFPVGCSTASYEQVFSTGSTNISLGTITINTLNAVATISGTVTDCNNAPVMNGNIFILNSEGALHYPVVNGNYSFNYLLCGNSSTNLTLLVSSDSLYQTSQTITINPGNNNVPNIQNCNIPTNFVNLTIYGTAYHFTDIPTPITVTQGASNSITITFKDPQYPLPNVINFSSAGINTGSIQPLTYLVWHGSVMVLSGPPQPVNITSYGAIGQSITGNFKDPPNSSSPTVTCSFRVPRTF